MKKPQTLEEAYAKGYKKGVESNRISREAIHRAYRRGAKNLCAHLLTAIQKEHTVRPAAARECGEIIETTLIPVSFISSWLTSKLRTLTTTDLKDNTYFPIKNLSKAQRIADYNSHFQKA